jgi:hypothetical protein
MATGKITIKTDSPANPKQFTIYQDEKLLTRIPSQTSKTKFYYDNLELGVYTIRFETNESKEAKEANLTKENSDITLEFSGPVLSNLSDGKRPESFSKDDKETGHIRIVQPTHEFLKVKLSPSTGDPSDDQSFWHLINRRKFNFKRYRDFIDDILNCNQSSHGIDYKGEKHHETKRLPFNRTEAYSLLKYATEKYVQHVYNISEFDPNDWDDPWKGYVGRDNIIPYYDLVKSKVKEYFEGKNCDGAEGFLKGKADVTLIELIWSYWYEEGMVNQTMLTIARRFQNIKNGYNDPLANLELDPLRPLNNILWGYIQDAQHRLSVARRNYEYEHLYGLRLAGVKIPGFNPADRRSKFLQSFHRLLQEATEYYVQADNAIIRPDGFKLLNAITDTHRILAEGAHNQFGDLPSVARIEMLIEQWILSRPEIREFLGGRIMVPYEEPWMDRVDSMKSLQGWDNTSISFYRDLAVYGEKILLGVRFGNWTEIDNRDNATNWADEFRDAIQRYIHSYYTVTGVDLSAKNVNINPEQNFLMPGMLIQQRIKTEQTAFRR